MLKYLHDCGLRYDNETMNNYELFEKSICQVGFFFAWKEVNILWGMVEKLSIIAFLHQKN